MAMIVDALMSQFQQALVTMAKEEVTMILGVKSEFKQLQDKVFTVRSLLEDAEHKAFTDTLVCNWLASLKDIVYDADDVFDIYRTKAEQRALLSSDRPVHCYTPFLSPFISTFRRVMFRHQIGTSIRSINARLDDVINGQYKLQLVAAAATATAQDDRSGSGGSSSRMHRQTDPIPEPDIVGAGIEENTSSMVGLIATEFAFPGVAVFAITGMGGIGKTTLAQKIYNHPTIKDCFQKPPPMWVCVSQKFTGTDLLKEIIRSAGGAPMESGSFAELQLHLVNVIKGKKFLLILDDVWGPEVWDDMLRKPLQEGASGSRVLITTRDAQVAMKMGAVHVRSVQPLHIGDGWQLLRKMVFQGDEEGIELVQDVGIQIVGKCDGLPLAIKTIAGVLKTKDRKPWEWERVLNNPAWSLTDLPNGVMGVLYLSYKDLPSHLKQCFIFCSLYPEDIVFMRHTLLQYWVAEGFIKEEHGMTMEEVAQGYYKELLRRSLLQADPKYYDYGGCRVHDLLRSLALFLAKDENFVGDVNGLDRASASSSKLRHVFIAEKNLSTLPEALMKHTSLRTLLFTDIHPIGEIPQEFFEKLRCLRVLDMNGMMIKKLPESLGNLIHLRHLDLSFCAITELPEIIGRLTNLQHLILQNCSNLRTLPNCAARLFNMRSLDLLDTRLDGMPVGIGRLKHMNRLMGFVTNESDGSKVSEGKRNQSAWCSLEELQSLNQLRTLTIENLERALIRTKPAGPLFRDNHHMQQLGLGCSTHGEGEQQYGEEALQRIQRLFEQDLFPPPALEKFNITGFFGLQFPSWLMNPSNFLYLKKIVLEKCRLCTQVPPLGLLPNLDNVHIDAASSIKKIGPEFMGAAHANAQMPRPSSCTPFPKLEKLKLENMDSLEEWEWNEGEKAMPHLYSLRILNCPQLRSLPGGLIHATALTTLTIEEAVSLTAIENLPAVKSLSLKDNRSLSRIRNLPSLKTMEARSCSRLRNIEGLPSLQSLSLVDESLSSFPKWLVPEEGGPSPFPLLESLEIVGNGDLLFRCLKDNMDWPKVQSFANVYIQNISSPEFVFYRRDPFTYNTNIELRTDGSGGSAPASDQHQ